MESLVVDTAVLTGASWRGAASSIFAGLIGRGIQKSRSPAMHESEGAAHGIKYSYMLFDTDRMLPPMPALDEILRAAEICGFSGLNITHPYKQDVIDYVDDLSDSAKLVGAVNTVVFRDGKRTGHNTDLWGFSKAFLRDLADTRRDNVLLIGAGGAGAAVAHALMDCGVGILWLVDSDQVKAESLAALVCRSHGPDRAKSTIDINEVTCKVDGIVNATPMGMAEFPGSPIPSQLLHPGVWVADIVYFPLETELLRIARASGCRTLTGAGMAVFQAVRAFELFTGLKPDCRRMEAVFNAINETAPS